MKPELGFTYWGSCAQYVAIHQADINLVALPGMLDFATAASLGCRFVTAFRAVVDQSKASAGQWVAVHGCGGVGLSAIMIANAVCANVVAIHIGKEELQLARELGAAATVNAAEVADVAAAVIEVTRGGAQVSLDGLGHLRLGVALFERSRTGYAPTPAGEDLASTSARVAAEVHGV